MIFGINSSGWAKDWSLDALIEHVLANELLALELQMGTAHGITTELEKPEREAVREKLSGLPLDMLGLATDERLDGDDAARKAAVERIRQVMKLSHDIGGFGVKIGARDLPQVGRRAAIAGIAKTTRELADFAQGWGQQVRLELTGDCADPETALAIFKAIDHLNVRLCWASQPGDVSERGVKRDLKTLNEHLGETVYVGRLDDDRYPYFDLLTQLRDAGYHHWVLLRTEGEAPADVGEAIAQQRRLFRRITKGEPSLDRQLDRR
ncbi:MAG: TIM barrel protein [Phycisphaeraceae bacterium]